MEIREFAERVLFSDDLGEKLRAPDADLVDLNPGSAVESPDIPGRPECLVPGSRDARGQFPGVHHIESDHDRARLLHFLANHELIAAELMALVLLKFPEAPKAFRQGILKTLLEEQHHTLWYIKRMESLGIQFGDQPVNGFIWNHIKSMHHPIDFVSRLSLTFEQANLDYSKFYAQQFANAGDNVTARIFEKIYRDEIEHVSHGLHWFRLWKKAEHTDWEAWKSRLVFPLSPMRAKGVPFNPEGRIAAGLDQEFIRELKVFSKSRGRTPSIYFYNPEAELVMASHGPFHPSKHMIQLIRDLEILPAYLAGKDDVTLVTRPPSNQFKARLIESGFSLPEFVLVHEDRKSFPENSELRSRRLGRFCPWSMSPDAIDLFRSLNNPATNDSRDLDASWNDSIQSVHSKSFACQLFRKIAPMLDQRNDTISAHNSGFISSNLDALLDKIHAWKLSGHTKFVIKSPFGAAGGNQLRLWENAISQRQINWIQNVLYIQKEVILEPWHNRIMDFSIQFEVFSDGKPPRTIGWTKLMNDHRGQFESIEFPFRVSLASTPEVARFMNQHGDGGSLVEIMEQVVSVVAENLHEMGYSGPAGIDAYVFKNVDGSLMLRPLVEINPRYTMGRLALDVGRRVQGGKCARFSLKSLAQLNAEGFSSFSDYDQSMTQHYPVRFSKGTTPQITSGYIPLNDPLMSESILATLVVGACLNTQTDTRLR